MDWGSQEWLACNWYQPERPLAMMPFPMAREFLGTSQSSDSDPINVSKSLVVLCLSYVTANHKCLRLLEYSIIIIVTAVSCGKPFFPV